MAARAGGKRREWKQGDDPAVKAYLDVLSRGGGEPAEPHRGHHRLLVHLLARFQLRHNHGGHRRLLTIAVPTTGRRWGP